MMWTLKALAVVGLVAGGVTAVWAQAPDGAKVTAPVAIASADTAVTMTPEVKTLVNLYISRDRALKAAFDARQAAMLATPEGKAFLDVNTAWTDARRVMHDEIAKQVPGYQLVITTGKDGTAQYQLAPVASEKMADAQK